jgi:predicted MPP superfamily phosphohydrolase
LVITNVLLRGEIHDGWLLDWTNFLGEAEQQGTPVIVVTAMYKGGTISREELEAEARKYRVVKVFFKDRLARQELEKEVKQAIGKPTKSRKRHSAKPRPSKEVEKFTWLHLSDLHFENTQQRKYQVDQVINALLDDLARLQEKEGLKPDTVFFTGDLTNKARPDEFTETLEKDLTKILNGCGLKTCNLFVVPGNHDVDRTQTTDLDGGIIEKLVDASKIYALFNEPTQKGYLQQLRQRMNIYHSALSSIKDLPLDAEVLSEVLSWGRVLKTKGGKQVGIIGLNSVWTSASVRGGDGEVADQGQLIIGKPLVEAALEQIRKELPKEQPNLDACIALMHHPLNWLQQWDQKDVKQILREKCHFVLHGHVHETTMDFLGRPDPSTMTISAGALFKKYEQGDIYTCMHAYNIVQLDLANQRGTIYFRRFDPVNQRYGVDDTTFLVRNGQYSFQYGDDGFRSIGNPA